ncbi:uncharacterized protein FTOL_06735 [Fusarium torulosum]|uniref:Uncharacterized protein n=1 Tax=Fusarium torulosum TaxID=33205 RepID=A0AAE8MC11_9HYPO|nr:uncharacterized protein FTOL_06735 [Fusarium torulosum]
MNVQAVRIYFILLFSLQIQCQAHPARNGYIREISSIEDVLFSIDPWLLHTSENFQLDFRLSLDVERIRLDLRPTNRADPFGQALHLETDGANELLDSWRSSMLLSDKDILLFEGDALLNRNSHGWHKVGWGRIAIRRPQPYLFEGFFTLKDDLYHVSLSDEYLRKRHQKDPSPPTSGSTHMVVWK